MLRNSLKLLLLAVAILTICLPKACNTQLFQHRNPQFGGSISRARSYAAERQLELGELGLSSGIVNSRTVTKNNGGLANGGTTSVARSRSRMGEINLGGLEVGSTLTRTKTNTNGAVSRALTHDLNLGGLGIETSLSKDNLRKGFGFHRSPDGGLDLGLGPLNFDFSKNHQSGALTQAQAKANGANAIAKSNTKSATQRRQFGLLQFQNTKSQSNALGKTKKGQTSASAGGFEGGAPINSFNAFPQGFFGRFKRAIHFLPFYSYIGTRFNHQLERYFNVQRPSLELEPPKYDFEIPHANTEALASYKSNGFGQSVATNTQIKQKLKEHSLFENNDPSGIHVNLATDDGSREISSTGSNQNNFIARQALNFDQSQQQQNNNKNEIQTNINEEDGFHETQGGSQDKEVGSQETQGGSQETQGVSQERQSGHQETQEDYQGTQGGSQETQVGFQETQGGFQETQGGSLETQGGSHETQNGYQATQAGLQETQDGSQGTQGGSHEAQSGYQATQAGLQETQAGSQETQGALHGSKNIKFGRSGKSGNTNAIVYSYAGSDTLDSQTNFKRKSILQENNEQSSAAELNSVAISIPDPNNSISNSASNIKSASQTDSDSLSISNSGFRNGNNFSEDNADSLKDFENVDGLQVNNDAFSHFGLAKGFANSKSKFRAFKIRKRKATSYHTQPRRQEKNQTPSPTLEIINDATEINWPKNSVQHYNHYTQQQQQQQQQQQKQLQKQQPQPRKQQPQQIHAQQLYYSSINPNSSTEQFAVIDENERNGRSFAFITDLIQSITRPKCTYPCTLDAYQQGRCCENFLVSPEPPSPFSLLRPLAILRPLAAIPPPPPRPPPLQHIPVPTFPLIPTQCCNSCPTFGYYGPPPCIHNTFGGAVTLFMG